MPLRCRQKLIHIKLLSHRASRTTRADSAVALSLLHLGSPRALGSALKSSSISHCATKATLAKTEALGTKEIKEKKDATIHRQ